MGLLEVKILKNHVFTSQRPGDHQGGCPGDLVSRYRELKNVTGGPATVVGEQSSGLLVLHIGLHGAAFVTSDVPRDGVHEVIAEAM